MSQHQKVTKSISVVKVGGNEIENTDFLNALCTHLLALIQNHCHPVVVHGGGKKIEDIQQALQIPIEKIDGFRVTTAASIQAVRMALIGLTSPQLALALRLRGLAAVSLNAADGDAYEQNSLLIGRKKANQKLGFVGDTTHVNASFIEKIISIGMVPVIAPLALDENGNWLNVNADDTATAVALALQATELFFVTNVQGLSLDHHVRLVVKEAEIDDLLKHRDVAGGMIPKLQAAKKALLGGVQEVSFGSLEAYANRIQTRMVL